MEYPDLHGRVIVRALPAELDATTEEEKRLIIDALESDADALIVRLDDGGVLICANIIDGGEGYNPGLIEAASMVVQEAVPIPDQGSAYVTKSNLQRLRDALRLVAR